MAGTNRIPASYKDTTMSSEAFTDEMLSAIIDDEADDKTIAAVNADPAARARLQQLRAAVSHVAAPIPVANPERRSASIAAALAAASPTTEVSSLAAARHVRETQPSRSRSAPRWLAVAAAAGFLIVTIPLLARFSGSDADETATTAAEEVDSASFGINDSGADTDTDAASDDAGDSSADAMDEVEGPADSDDAALLDTADQDAVEEAATAETDGFEPDAAADEQEATTVAPAETEKIRVVVSNLDILEEFITLGAVAAQLTAEQVIAEGVPAACVEPLADVDTATFDLVVLDDFGGTARLILVIFNQDGSTTALDAEDCAQLG